MKPPPRKGQDLLAEGVALMRQGQFAEAEVVFLGLLKREPRNANACYFLGLALAQAGRLEEGSGHMRRAATFEPRNALFHLNLGIALMQMGREEDALISLNRAVALGPNIAQGHYNRGVICLKLKRLDEAIVALETAVKLQPDFADAHSDLGYALAQRQRRTAALAAYQRAHDLRPDSTAYRINIAMALCALDRYSEALPILNKVLSSEPYHEAALAVRAQSLIGLNRAEEALDAAETLLAKNPRGLKGYFWRAAALIRLGHPEEALKVAETARELAPEDVLVHLIRGQVLPQLNRHEEGLAAYNEALKLNPDDVDAIWRRALILLTLGHFEEGWLGYEARKRKPYLYSKPDYPKPLWLGQEALINKRLFVYWEQGFGDTIQFSRYLRLAAAAGAEVVFSIQDPLRRLFEDFGPNITLIGPTEVPNTFDLHCPLMSMPLGFGTRLDTIPSIPGGYLKAPDKAVGAWQKRLPTGRRLIGLVWSGNPIHDNDKNRSLPLARLQGLLDTNHFWVSLQKDVRETDRSQIESFGLLDLTAELRDFADTAALISALDLVISVDTSVAHLTGALGKPCWVMLPFAGEYRWLHDRDDSPWYPGMRLFRQQRPNDWEEVAERIRTALQAMP